MGTLDAHLIAIDAKNGRPLWNVDGRRRASSATRSRMAPLVVKDKVIVGVGGGEYGIRGFIAAYDAQDRQGSVALLHDSRRRASRARRAAVADALRPSVEARRRLGVGDRLVRSGR